MNKFIKDKFQNVSAFNYFNITNIIIINFSGFEQEEDLNEFCEFVFRAIKMPSNYSDRPPTVH